MSNTNKTWVRVDNRRTIAIDWSGAAKGASSKIWLAEVHKEKLVRLESGRNRAEVISHIIKYAPKESETVVGIDFAFSLPFWFARSEGMASTNDLWSLVQGQGEQWLQSCTPPFWGKPGKKKPELPEHFRLTEKLVGMQSSIKPKSVFQINGNGSVGTGSIRGMPYLAKLRSAGFSIWPFHEVANRMVVEIYPRLLTGSINKSSYEARLARLSRLPELDGDLIFKAACSDDAFDATVSAVMMSRHIGEFSSLGPTQDPTKQFEGEIWCPLAATQAAK